MTNAINSIAHAIATHPAISGAIAAWLVGNIAAALPSPDATSGKHYKFFFAFMHGIGGSIPRLGATLFPQYAKYFGASAIAPEVRNPCASRLISPQSSTNPRFFLTSPVPSATVSLPTSPNCYYVSYVEERWTVPRTVPRRL